MSLRPVHQAEEQVVELEDEVLRAESALQQVERRARTMAVEADAARDPAQFRAALLGRRLRAGTVAGVVGFAIGVSAGTWLMMLVSSMLRG
jgi:hypothetical protein